MLARDAPGERAPRCGKQQTGALEYSSSRKCHDMEDLRTRQSASPL